MPDFLLSALVFIPLAGAAALVPVWRHPAAARRVALAAGGAQALLVLLLLLRHPSAGAAGPPGFYLMENASWIPRFGIRYILGLDGMSLLLIALTAAITVVAMLSSWTAIRERVALHYFLLLVMESGITGVFLSLDLFLFYLFWEVMLIPMFLLIGIWGHGRRVYSAIKFFLYTMTGSLLMLVAILAVVLVRKGETGSWSFALFDLLGTPLSSGAARWLFGAFLLAFAIKFPVFPLHTWLPDAHTDAPTAGSVILAALLLKTGAYGLIRFGYPLFPQAAKEFTLILVTAGVIGIVYGSWVAFAQKDMKRLIAYSSVGHMGFIALGIAAWTPVALSGAVLQMVNHGITTGALFLLVGMLDQRTNTREIADYGGVWRKAPVLSLFFILFSMASAGIPGLNNFVGEFLVLAGSFRVQPAAVTVAAAGIVLPLAYTVRLVQEILFVEERSPLAVPDVTPVEGGLLAVLAASAVAIGVHPAPLLEMVRPPVEALMRSGGGLP